ncbi:mycofactocin biosynthesis glycosyltransferase MftF [Anaeromyxobacter oryzae]|uniref:Glycosyltransferase n=1 Tax=Anaeromyxobacter oryzae TaxID=2918170 RepID=A0ABM7X1F5_9BACT|nr:mycofactocin biosynthesis glycosyltransferase MftF [Anaeromyxobacter oryzae]BDG05574.1 putative glycosyltransferase [Anaeromyxobacter oryzae]
MRYRLASGVARVEVRGGPALLSRAPLRLVKVSAAFAERFDAGELVARTPTEARALDALFERGLLARVPDDALPADRLPTVSVVIPVKDRAEELRRCLESLRRVRYPRARLEIVVVDDGSRDATPAVARALGATVISSGGRGRGPAAARNRGAAVASGALLAFIDSDCTASEGWLAELTGRFEDPEVVAVGGRVAGMHASSALDRYEAEMSSLSLGPRDRSGQGGTDTFYLPSCNLLVRRRAFAASGGFREELHVGEDVDLTWRLRDRGGRVLYTPHGRIFHEHRNRLGAFLRRRFQYGTSEGLLQVLHPERRKQMVMPWPLAAATALVAAAWLARAAWPAVAGAALILLDVARLWATLRREGARVPPEWVIGARLRAWGSLAYHVAFHLTRYYAPVLIVAGVAWPRLGALAATLAVLCAAVDRTVRRPALRFPEFLGLYLAEHLAYGAGVFCGCVRLGSFGSYRPVLSVKQ